MPNTRQTWPYASTDPWLNRDNKPAYYLTPDGYLKSGRPLAGPLRMGTEPRVGPRGRAVEADNSGRSDFGMDRIEPRDFDPMGTCRNRFGDIPSDLVARQVRGNRNGE